MSWSAELLQLAFDTRRQAMRRWAATAAAAVAVNKGTPPKGRWGQCSVYRHQNWA